MSGQPEKVVKEFLLPFGQLCLSAYIFDAEDDSFRFRIEVRYPDGGRNGSLDLASDYPSLIQAEDRLRNWCGQYHIKPREVHPPVQ